MDALKDFLVNLPIPVWVKVMASSMIPMVEARYAILFFMDSGMPFPVLFLLSVLGNMVPVPIIMLIFRPVLESLKKTKLFAKPALKIEMMTNKKAKKVLKYEYLGLLIFVAIPAPGTGAISGAMAASLLGLRISRSLVLIFIGTIIATFITSGAWSVFMSLLSAI